MKKTPARWRLAARVFAGESDLPGFSPTSPTTLTARGESTVRRPAQTADLA
ncbi:MAG: hypothetical protein ACM3YN_00995 [Parcubacteria group bacterium]